MPKCNLKKGSDHPKVWDLLKIVYIALTDELLGELVRLCIRSNMEPSVYNYRSSFSKKKQPKLRFCLENGADISSCINGSLKEDA